MAREVDLGKVHGDTPYIGEDGNWWIGDKNTGVTAGNANSSKSFCTYSHFDPGTTSYNIALKFSKVDDICQMFGSDFDNDANFLKITISIIATNHRFYPGASTTCSVRIDSADKTTGKISEGTYEDGMINIQWIGQISGYIFARTCELIISLNHSKNIGPIQAVVQLELVPNVIRNNNDDIIQLTNTQ